MANVNLPIDALIIAYDPPFSLPLPFWERIASELEARLDVPVLLCDGSRQPEEVEHQAKSILDSLEEARVTRASLISIQGEASVLACVQTARIWKFMEQSSPSRFDLYSSEPWGPTDWAELIGCSPMARSHRWVLDVRDCGSLPRADYEWVRSMVAQTVWELRQLGIDCDFQTCEMNESSTSPVISLPWTSSSRKPQSSTPILRSHSSSLPVAIETLLPVQDWVHLVVGHYLRSFQTGPIPLPWNRDPATHARSVRVDSTDGLIDLRKRMNELLPTEYRGLAETVSPNSMGSASLRFDAEGRVPWDQIWTSFCDLALAGGPPHRGTLLEAVSREDCELELEAYRQVEAEIRRGIRLAAQLETQESAIPGWVGVVCDDEEMAVWLMRAIITENVMVRREGTVLYLPAGPKFRIKKEIKNVITSVAKTVHYWRNHRDSSGMVRT
jgi:hypothetical protein